MATVWHRVTQMPTRTVASRRGRGAVCVGEEVFGVREQLCFPPPLLSPPQSQLDLACGGKKMLGKHKNCSSVKLNRSCLSERESRSRSASQLDGRWRRGAPGCQSWPRPPRRVRGVSRWRATCPSPEVHVFESGKRRGNARGGIGAAAGRCTATPPRPAPAAGAAARGARTELGQDAGGPGPLPALAPGAGRGANPRGRAGVCGRGSGKAAGGVGARP